MATIHSKEIFEELLTKLAEGYLHYENQMRRTIDLKEYFEMYTSHLITQRKLHHYCKYKSKPIDVDNDGYCREDYCSKKPYHSQCPFVTLKFGKEGL